MKTLCVQYTLRRIASTKSPHIQGKKTQSCRDDDKTTIISLRWEPGRENETAIQGVNIKFPLFTHDGWHGIVFSRNCLSPYPYP